MPIKILNCGASVLLDAEDWELVEQVEWCLFTLCPSGRPAAQRQQRRFGRVFRLFLHREVAMRLRPDVIGRHFRVTPINGDYLDCRRENLNVVAKKKGRGRPRIEARPVGTSRHDYRGKRASVVKGPISPAWAGGYEYLDKNRDYKGEGRRVRKCISGKPID